MVKDAGPSVKGTVAAVKSAGDGVKPGFKDAGDYVKNAVGNVKNAGPDVKNAEPMLRTLWLGANFVGGESNGWNRC